MSAASDQKSLLELLTNSYASVRVAGAVLPPPALDPNVRATNSLHYLWQQLRIFVRLTAQGPHFAPPPNEPSLSPASALARVGPYLVSWACACLRFYTNTF